MKPRRTHLSDVVYGLQGGNEDKDLWVQRTITPDGRLAISSVWVPTDEERERIAAGENIELVVYGGQPPVAMGITDVPLGRPAAEESSL